MPEGIDCLEGMKRTDLLQAMAKREEIYAQIDYLLNMLRQIDIVYQRGDEVLSEEELRQYLKLDSKSNIPKDIPKIRVGMQMVYYRKDVVRFLEARRRTGR